jgi:hypothetical protein
MSAEDAADDAGGFGFSGFIDFKNSVIFVVATWVVKNVFIDPAETLFDMVDWAFALVIDTVDSGIRGALSTAGSAIWDAFLGPSGAVTSLQETMVGAATSAGIASPLASGLVNIALVAMVVGVLFLLARAAAGYVSGGVLA